MCVCVVYAVYECMCPMGLHGHAVYWYIYKYAHASINVHSYRCIQMYVHYTDSGITTDIEVIISSSYQVS